MLQQLWAPHTIFTPRHPDTQEEQAAPRLGTACWNVCTEELHLCSVSHPEQSESLARPWLEFGAFASLHAVQMAG